MRRGLPWLLWAAAAGALLFGARRLLVGDEVTFSCDRAANRCLIEVDGDASSVALSDIHTVRVAGYSHDLQRHGRRTEDYELYVYLHSGAALQLGQRQTAHAATVAEYRRVAAEAQTFLQGHAPSLTTRFVSRSTFSEVTKFGILAAAFAVVAFFLGAHRQR